MKQIFFYATLFLCGIMIQAQNQYQISAIGYYNLENLFYPTRDTNIYDEEFTPEGSKNYTFELYHEKLHHLSTVISELGTDKAPEGVSLLGVSEIENRKVLEDLILQPELSDRNYAIIHEESVDKRGIDVGLIYNQDHFQVSSVEKLDINSCNPDTSDYLYTRYVLYISGIMDNEVFHVFVNHWPSRSGGEAASSYKREMAACRVKMVVDSIQSNDDNANIIVMGDLNDDPSNDSVKKVLKAGKSVASLSKNQLYDPYWLYFKKGIGSLAWDDSWNLFDHVIVSKGLTEKSDTEYFFYQAHIHNKEYLKETHGQYKGYPKRTFLGDKYNGGYSDHFPVYIYLVQPIAP